MFQNRLVEEELIQKIQIDIVAIPIMTYHSLHALILQRIDFVVETVLVIQACQSLVDQQSCVDKQLGVSMIVVFEEPVRVKCILSFTLIDDDVKRSRHYVGPWQCFPALIELFNGIHEQVAIALTILDEHKQEL